jgi:putative lipoprotein
MRLPGVLIAAAVIACTRPAQVPAMAGTEWTLVELAGQPAPTGAGGRRATLRFGTDSARAAGFAGCNRYAGTYTVDGQTLHFGPLLMTKMACTEGNVAEIGHARFLYAVAS